MKASFLSFKLLFIYFPEIEIHTAQRSVTWCALYLGQSNKKNPTNTHIYSIKTYLKSYKLPANEKKKLLALKVLEILPMTVENKDPQLLKFVFKAWMSKIVNFKIRSNFSTIIQIEWFYKLSAKRFRKKVDLIYNWHCYMNDKLLSCIKK